MKNKKEFDDAVFSINESLRDNFGLPEEESEKLLEMVKEIYSQGKEKGVVSFEEFDAIMDVLCMFCMFASEEEVRQFVAEKLWEM